MKSENENREKVAIDFLSRRKKSINSGKKSFKFLIKQRSRIYRFAALELFDDLRDRKCVKLTRKWNWNPHLA